jgi:ribose transport system ATP-binding protein
VKAVADRVTVLRDGKKVATRPAAELQPVDMARLMVGRDLLALYPPRAPGPSGPAVLEVARFGAEGFAEGVRFTVSPGEILGFSGLVGAGRTELFEALFGLRKGGGEIRLDGRPQRWTDARAGMRAGAVYLTEDRKSKGLLLEETLATNLTLAALDKFQRGPLIDGVKEAKALDAAIKRFDIRVGDKNLLAGQMSGGNQQKLLLAKMMELDPRVVVIDEPTRGIDIGAKQQIYRFIAGMAGEGRSVIVISSEMAELIGICHRIIVMRNGRIAGEVAGEAMTEHAIVVLATGVDAGPGEISA